MNQSTKYKLSGAKKIAIIVAALLAFVSCFDKEKYDYIPKDQKPNLQNGDTVYFVNHQDKSLVDTFVVQISTDYEVFDKTHYWETLSLSYENDNKAFSVDYGSRYGLMILAGASDWTSYKGNELTDISISGVKYQAIIFNKRYPTSELLPDTLYYSYKKGIIRYDYSDTNYYEIKK